LNFICETTRDAGLTSSQRRAIISGGHGPAPVFAGTIQINEPRTRQANIEHPMLTFGASLDVER
jgi:hypothetical protein